MVTNISCSSLLNKICGMFTLCPCVWAIACNTIYFGIPVHLLIWLSNAIDYRWRKTSWGNLLINRFNMDTKILYYRSTTVPSMIMMTYKTVQDLLGISQFSLQTNYLTQASASTNKTLVRRVVRSWTHVTVIYLIVI